MSQTAAPAQPIADTGPDLSGLSDADIAAFRARQKWLLQARSSRRRGKQIPPIDGDWQILLIKAGRGFGKTFSLSQWIWWECWRVPGIVGHFVAPTLGDARGTAFEGPAGLLACIPQECLLGGTKDKAYNSTRLELKLRNGSLIRGFGAVEEAGRLRGPQCHALACDELREFDRPAGNLEVSISNALLGLRLPYPDGTPARALFATTAKPIPFLKRLEKRSGVIVVEGTSYENLPNLSSTFRSQLLSMEGTALGRQEIYAAYIDEESDLSIVKRAWINLWPVKKPMPVFQFVIESYDTAASEENFNQKKQFTDPTACIVLGVFNVNEAFTEAERKKLGYRGGKLAVLLLDAWSERMGLPELLERAQRQHRTRWGPAQFAKQSDLVLIEDKSSGPGLRQFLHRWNIPAWPANPGRRDKAMRLHGVSPLIFAGCMFVPESMRPDREGLPRDWAEAFLDVLCAYAGKGSVEHDDYVDVTTQAFAYLRDRGMLDAPPDQKNKDRDEIKDEEERAAIKAAAEQQRRSMGNPYG